MMETTPTRVPAWAWRVMIGLLILLVMAIAGLSLKQMPPSVSGTGTANANALAQLAECKAQYGRLLSIIGQQTSILQGESAASKAAFDAIRNQNLDAFNASTDKVEALSSQEGDVQAGIDQLDSAACK